MKTLCKIKSIHNKQKLEKKWVFSLSLSVWQFYVVTRTEIYCKSYLLNFTTCVETWIAYKKIFQSLGIFFELVMKASNLWWVLLHFLSL